MRLLDTHIRTIASTRVGVDYEIAIWLPPSYATGRSGTIYTASTSAAGLALQWT